MIIGDCDTSVRAALVAEIGLNHEGSVARAAQMIRSASQAGADAVKLQTFVPELYAPWGDTERLARLRAFGLSHEDTVRLILDAREEGIEVFSTPFDLVSAEVLLRATRLVKVASGDITFAPLIDRLAASDADLIISTGACTLGEVLAAVQRIVAVRGHERTAASTAVLHCVSSYPAPVAELNLTAITVLRESLDGLVVGYSDHSTGVATPALAVAAGARIVEKHVTLDRGLSDFRDHALSVTPDELAEVRARMDAASAAVGDGRKQPQHCEEAMREAIRRSVVIARPLLKGQAISNEDLVCLRPGGGLNPGVMSELIGQRTARALEPGHRLAEEDLG